MFAYAQDLKQEEIDRINKYVKANVPRQIKNYKLIMNDDKIIGCILVEKYLDGFLLDEIYIKKEYRNKKIGTELIKDIQTKYSPVYLWVYKQNIRAYNLYKRLGFDIEQETETRYFMKYINITVKKEGEENMDNKEVIEKIRNLTKQEQKNLSYEELVEIVKKLTIDEIIELSKVIGYPVFLRKCMGELQHIIPILQDGAAAIIENEKGEILLQRRVDDDNWGLPGGCQELGERFQEVIIREIKEETNLEVKEEDLELLDIISGLSRRKEYPNGDVVINNTALYLVKKYSGDLIWDDESKDMKFFSLDSLPKNQHDSDLIKVYINKKRR